MKKINLAVPVMLAAALAVSACSKTSDSANTLTVSDAPLNDEDALTENGSGNDTYLSSENAATTDALTSDNATASGNAQ